MAHRSSCRSCRHCTPPQGNTMGWCQLRQLQIHPDLAGDLWCHHWSARSPRLPHTGPQDEGVLAVAGSPATRQLSLEAVLPQF